MPAETQARATPFAAETRGDNRASDRAAEPAARSPLTTTILSKADGLLAYRDYLEDAQRWKAEAKATPGVLDREVAVQAAQAMNDARTLAVSAVEATGHLKHAGGLDHMLDAGPRESAQRGR